MTEQTTYTCNKCKKEKDESYFSCRLKSCDDCTDKNSTYRLSVKEFNKNYHENSLFKNEGLDIYDELRYEYHRMEIPCPLCECMISRFRTAQHQVSKKM